MGTGFELKDGEVILRINPRVYSLERVYATAYIFLDNYYILLDGDKENEIIVSAKPKQAKQNMEEFANTFFEELLSITNYFNQLEKNQDVVKIMLEKALSSVEPIPLTKEEEKKVEEILEKS